MRVLTYTEFINENISNDYTGVISHTNKEDLIKKCDGKYGEGKYDYSKIPSYFHSTEILKIKCKKHGEFKRKSYLFINGSECPKCQKENMRLKTPEFIKRANLVHDNKYDYSKVDYKGGLEPIIISCKKHGDFRQIPEQHIAGNGCPYCDESKGERNIMLSLKELNIDFIRFKKFNDCVSDKGKKLSFDFYLPDYNTCIEYDGIQHSKPVDRFGGEESFNRQKLLDQLKNQYCQEKNIKLIRINYTTKGYNNILNYLKTKFL